MTNNNELEQGFAALRAETSDPVAAQKALRALRQPRKRLDWRLAGIPLAAAILTASFLATPRTSSASDLRAILDTLHASNTWVATMFAQDGKGQEVVAMQIASDGDVYKVTFNPGAPGASPANARALALVGGRRITFLSDCTVIDESAGPVWRMGRAVWFKQAPDAIIDDLLQNKLVTNVSTRKSLNDHDRILDEYVVAWRQGSTDERSGRIALYTEAGTKRPVRMLGVGGNSLGLHSEWRYDDVPKALVDTSIPKSLPCYDLAAQRREFEELLREGLSRFNGKPHVVGVWADHSGSVTVMTSGDAGLLADATNGIGITGLGSGGTAGFAWNSVSVQDGVRWCVPTNFQGVPTIAHTLRFKERVPDQVLLKVQIWTKLDPKATAVLPWKGPVHRTYSLPDLFSPETKPYFLSEDQEAPGVKFGN
ncbi:MAG: hypothetical protein JSS66_17735 [Armatimonadetes bacterium]|nr:hypothetical protein [Armatimonadota bacterium]